MAKKEKRMSEDVAGPEAISPAADVAADDSRNSESAPPEGVPVSRVDLAIRMIQYLTDNATISRDAASAIIAGLNAHRDKLETL